MRTLFAAAIALLAVSSAHSARAEDGYEWNTKSGKYYPQVLSDDGCAMKICQGSVLDPDGKQAFAYCYGTSTGCPGPKACLDGSSKEVDAQGQYLISLKELPKGTKIERPAPPQRGTNAGGAGAR